MMATSTPQALPSPPLSDGRKSPHNPVPADLTPLIESTYQSSELKFYVNGVLTVIKNPNPEWILLDWIRAQDGLKGTKLGCGEGGCGACTVVLQTGLPGGRIRHDAVNACLFPLVGVDGKGLITIEGLGSVKNPHPLQERVPKMHGSQCGFCTPGIIMSLYALIRNSYYDGKFHLTTSDVELRGHLDGNLCRCTGYKPILEAARSFVLEDLKGTIKDTPMGGKESEKSLETDLTETAKTTGEVKSSASCGRPGGCCRDKPGPSACSSSTPPEESKNKRSTPPPEEPEFLPYRPESEPIFPPSLRKHEPRPLCYGNRSKLWFRPVTLQQLLDLKSTYPQGKIVGGASETQIEVRFKKRDYRVSIYAADIPELRAYTAPETDAEVDALQELRIPANLPLTAVEDLCTALYRRMGRRASVLEALRKQLRYFAGRQIRNVASLAGSLATASPISDSAPVLMAAGASVVIQSRQSGVLQFPLSRWFLGYRTTALPEDGVITEIVIPLPSEGDMEITKAYKQAKRKDDDIAIVTSGMRIRLDADGKVDDVSIAFGGLAATTVFAENTQKAVLGRVWTDTATLEAGLDALLEDFNLPQGVPGGMAHYRRTLSLSMFFRFWHEANHDLGLATFDKNLIDEIHRDISSGSHTHTPRTGTKAVGKALPHLSALKHCTGEAEYLDDMPKQHNELFGAVVLSTQAHAEIVSVDWSRALEMPGVVNYLDKDSVPVGGNKWGPVKKDEVIFADGKVEYYGQVIGMICATSALEARAAADQVKVEYKPLPAIFTISEAINAKSFFDHGKELRKGDAVAGSLEDAFSKCEHVFSGISKVGGQEHFYLETQAAFAIPHMEDGSMDVYASTQNLMENQVFVAQVLGVTMSKINMRVRRMGGAYGGKESRSTPFACMVALAAQKLKRPVRIMLNRDEDISISGQRHPFQCRWKVGVNGDGRIQCLEADVYNNAGYSLDMSGAVMDRACTHIDNCYHVPNVWVRGWVCKTNTVSNTAYRGFGGPQGMYFAETIIFNIAEKLNLDVDELRLRNLYSVGQTTPFLQLITDDFHVPTMMEQLSKTSDFEARKLEVAEFNAKNRFRKRGIVRVPTKFGLSFATALALNQAGAYVKIYEDGSVLLHHGGTEMGQGLYTKMCQVAAEELGVSTDEIYNKESQTDQVANPSPTGASSGSDLNGMAVKNACDQLNERLAPYREKYGADAPLKTIAHAAYADRVNLAANGFWKMPRIGYQWGNWKDPMPMYYYWTQGVAVTEVELDVLTGDHTVLRADLMMDIGRSINPAIDYGQIEGAFVQGQGLFTMEESLWTGKGEIFTKGPGTYKIPGFSDIPQVFNISMLERDSSGNPISWESLRSIQSSKGVGEPPLFLGSTVFFALREAVKAARVMNGSGDVGLLLNAPSTAEKLRLAVADRLVEKAKVVLGRDQPEFFKHIED
ncbi:xanthine dehydrogenase [Sarocladium strictum]